MAEIILTRGLSAIVSREDFEELSKYKWHAVVTGKKTKKYYAARKAVENGKEKVIYMHRQLVCPRDGMEVEHLNGNSLDNRRNNLRERTRSENLRNSLLSTGKGVYFDKQNKKWAAMVMHKDRRILVGLFWSREEAEIQIMKKKLELNNQNESARNPSQEQGIKNANIL